MATSIPNGDYKKQIKKTEYPIFDYPNKESVNSILSSTPGNVISLWQNDNHEDDNRLYYGDNLPILLNLLKDKSVKGRVKLIYIDPPFSTNGVFQSRKQKDAYTDIITGIEYIEFIRKRLAILGELLSDDGSIYVHLDKNMAFYIKIIMDEIFGIENFRNWITRQKCNRKNYTKNQYGNIADYILFYTKSNSYTWSRAFEPWPEEKIKREYQYIDENGRRYKKVPIHAPGVRNGETGKEWKGMMPPPGKHWQYTPDKLDEMDLKGEIYWSPTGNPRRKVYFDNSEGIPVQDIWLEFKDAHNQNIYVTGYPTEKNPDLLKRIIHASSNPGDLILDCFSGSGTTLAVASELNRRWIGIDNSIEAIKTTLKRFKSGTKPMGDFVKKNNQTSKGKTIRLDSFTDKKGYFNNSFLINNFTLFALESYSSEIDEIMKEFDFNSHHEERKR